MPVEEFRLSKMFVGLSLALVAFSVFTSEGAAQTRRRFGEVTKSLSPEVRSAIAAAIDRKFGSDQLVYASSLPIDFGKKEAEGLEREFGWKLRLGRRLYQQRCSGCHGTWGAGDGPQAKELPVPPRDFYSGWFRWTSTGIRLPPRWHDIAETIRIGIPGTPMHSHELRMEERYAVAEFVRWLSIRGRIQRRLHLDMEGEEQADVSEVNDWLGDEMIMIGEQWQTAEDSNLEIPDDRPASAESAGRGRALYTKLQCHNKSGRFVIPDLPAGEHTFIVWHEKAQYVRRKLKVLIEEDDMTEVEIKMDASMLK